MPLYDTLRFLGALKSPKARAAYVLHEAAKRLGVPERLRAGLSNRVGGRYADGENVFVLRFRTLDAWTAHPSHERATHGWLKQMLAGPKRGVMLDVGAYVGTFCFRHRKSFDAVYAFEPFPENYKLLTVNIKQTIAERLYPVRSAVSDVTGTTRLFLDTADTHSIETGKGRSIVVDTTTLDDFIAKQNIPAAEIRLIKVDVEGAEMKVLKGAANLLKEGNPVILMEANSPKEEREQADYLGMIGYKQTQILDKRNFVYERAKPH